MDKELKTEINRAAHLMAQQQYAAYRLQLFTECKRMLGERKTRAEILAWLSQVAIRRIELSSGNSGTTDGAVRACMRACVGKEGK